MKFMQDKTKAEAEETYLDAFTVIEVEGGALVFFTSVEYELWKNQE